MAKASATPSRHRTLVVWLFVIVAILAGLYAFLDAARYMGWLPIASLGEMKFFAPSIYWLGAIMSAVVGVIWFTVAKWLYDLNPQGWLFVVIIAILNLILLLMAIIGKTTIQAVAGGLVLNALALILAFLPGTQKAFGRA